MEQETVFVIMLKNKETGFLEKETQIKRENNNHLTPLVPPPSPLREGRDEAFNMQLTEM